jgi:hypothetical protein
VIFLCMRVLGWGALIAWGIGTGFEVTGSWPTIAFWAGLAILVLQALTRHALARWRSRASQDEEDPLRG